MERKINERFDAVLALLPRSLACAISAALSEAPVEEIRLRASRPPQIITARDETVLRDALFTIEDAKMLLDKLCRHSVYSYADELQQGFIALEGGIRVGVCGRPVVENGRIVRLLEVTSFNIRITREVIGCAEGVMPHITEKGRPVSSLIISPPGGGKTTLLRDIARCVSDGCGALPSKTAIVDERGELAGCVGGLPSFNIGVRTDVMELAPKAEAVMQLIRSMSPEVIVTDELGSAGDAEAIAEAARCGTAVISSAHAASRDELILREPLKNIISTGVFKRILLIKRSGSVLRILPLIP